MCSWCWGFAPTLHQIEITFGFPIRVVNGGLRPGPYAQILDQQMADYLRGHWVQVAEASGQPFDPSFLDQQDGWVFNSEVPAIAVTAMRSHDETLALTFFSDIQRAFFANGVDITDPSEYRPLLTGYPVDTAGFLDYLVGDEGKQAAWRDFEEARSLGITAFPALFLKLGDELALVTRGWLPFEQLETPLRTYFADSGYEIASGASCSPGV